MLVSQIHQHRVSRCSPTNLRKKFCQATSKIRSLFSMQMAGGFGRNGCGWFAFHSSSDVVCSYMPLIYYNFYFTTTVLLSGNECFQAMVTDDIQTACFTDSQNAISGNSLGCWRSLYPARRMPLRNIKLLRKHYGPFCRINELFSL